MSLSPRPGPPTIRDVADLAGVSMMTVSRHLRRLPGVAKKTASRIEEAIVELGYRPNPSVQALMSAIRRRAPGTPVSNLAFLTFGASEHVWKTSEVSLRIFAGASAEAERQGYTLTPVWAESAGVAGERLAEILTARGILGFLVSPLTQVGDFPATDFPWESFSTVALGYSLKTPALNVTATNQWALMDILVRELLTDLSLRPGLILSHGLDQRVGGQWLSAYLYHKEMRQTLPPPLLFTRATDQAETQATIDRWIQTHRIGIVLADAEALHLLRQMEPRLHHSPHILQLDQPEVTLPGGAKIARDYQRLGAVAVRMLISQILLDQRGIPEKPVHQLLDPLITA